MFTATAAMVKFRPSFCRLVETNAVPVTIDIYVISCFASVAGVAFAVDTNK